MSRPLAFLRFPRDFDAEPGISAVVDRVHEGDTFFAFLSYYPVGLGPFVAIRVAGLREPELWDEGGLESRAALEEVLPRDAPLKVAYSNWSFNRIVMRVRLRDGADLTELRGGTDAVAVAAADESAPTVPRAKVHDALAFPPAWSTDYNARDHDLRGWGV